MDERLKRRLVGAAVLVVAAVVFVPMVLDQGSETPPQPSRSIPSTSPLPLPTPRLAPENTDVRVLPLESPVVPLPAEPPKPAKIAKPAPPPKEKAPAKVASKPAAPKPAANSGFAVQLGSFSKAGNAVGLRDKLNAKGYKAFMKTSGSVSRVYVGPQKTRAEAQKALEKLLADTKMKGIVVSYPG
jgi:DedD protein